MRSASSPSHGPPFMCIFHLVALLWFCAICTVFALSIRVLLGFYSFGSFCLLFCVPLSHPDLFLHGGRCVKYELGQPNNEVELSQPYFINANKVGSRSAHMINREVKGQVSIQWTALSDAPSLTKTPYRSNPSVTRRDVSIVNFIRNPVNVYQRMALIFGVNAPRGTGYRSIPPA